MSSRRLFVLGCVVALAGGSACQDAVRLQGPATEAPEAQLGHKAKHSPKGPSPAVMTTVEYGNIVLDGSVHWMPGSWDLTKGDVTVTYEADLTGTPNVRYTGNFGQAVNVGLFNAAAFSGGNMSGFLFDADNAGTEFPTYPDLDGTQDLDDKFNAQRFPNPGSFSETMYDVLCASNTVVSPPIGSFDNYGIWFDRDGVDPFQEDAWGAVDDGTYNTSATYPLELLYRRVGTTNQGTLCPTHAPNQPRLNDPAGGSGVPTGFDRQSDGSYSDYPAGIHWEAGSEGELADMKVRVAGSPGNGAIVVEDLTVTGYLAITKNECKKGGWETFGFRNQGQCIRFVNTGKDSR